MGVVVSGETGRPATSGDKKRVKNIMSENDYGLLLVALDRFTDFFGSWSITGLSSRVQVRKAIQTLNLYNSFLTHSIFYFVAYFLVDIQKVLVSLNMGYRSI